MYARATLLEIDTVRVGVGEAVGLFESEVLPGLRDQVGYLGVLVLSTPEGKGVLLSFWESEEAAEQETGFYETEIAKYLMLFRSPPGREAYRIELADGVSFPAH